MSAQVISERGLISLRELTESEIQFFPVSEQQSALLNSTVAPGTILCQIIEITIDRQFSHVLLKETIDFTAALQRILRCSIEKDTSRSEYWWRERSHLVVPVSVYDFRYLVQGKNLSIADFERSWASHIEMARLRVFDRNVGPLFSVDVARVTNEEFRVVLSLDHAVVDGKSLEWLKRNVPRIYTTIETGTGMESVETPAAQYAHFCHAQYERLSLITEKANRQPRAEFWRDQLSAACFVKIQSQVNSRVAIGGGRGAERLTVHLSSNEFHAVESLQKRSRGSLNSTMAALVLRAGLRNQERASVVSVLAERPYPELEHAIGVFTGLALFSIDRQEIERTVEETIRSITRQTLIAYDHLPVSSETNLITDDVAVLNVHGYAEITLPAFGEGVEIAKTDLPVLNAAGALMNRMSIDVLRGRNNIAIQINYPAALYSSRDAELFLRKVLEPLHSR